MRKLNYLNSFVKTVFINKTIFIETRCDSNGKFLSTKYSIKSPFISPTNQIPKRRKIKLILFRTFKSEQSTALIRVCRIECAQIYHRNISCISMNDILGVDLFLWQEGIEKLIALENYKLN